ncbi:hypothetical protein A6R68_04558 [Neotoma lepida]|uniref:DNA-directed primase/polymerase protein n=1 Tax=Neotoma lepida TaxID=56216 RepID=A0A1A6GKU4_NEOLE|nr:hypothetical protein A6R68_04558 [Neotoma lepida]
MIQFRKTLLHCYEVIPENAVCKLYFDLEFNKLANPGADGKKMVALLIEHVCKALEELYNVHCSAEDVFNLDSSTEEKFSRHLIFQLHDVAFKDNIHVGEYLLKDRIESIEGFQCSPYPEVDQFVLSLVNKHDIKGVKSHILTNLYSSILLLFSIKIKEEFTSDEGVETGNSLTKNSQNPPSSNLSLDQFSDADWDDEDDACFLEATEDAEFADAADKSLLGDKSAMDDIPDELIIEALQSS